MLSVKEMPIFLLKDLKRAEIQLISKTGTQSVRNAFLIIELSYIDVTKRC